MILSSRPARLIIGDRRLQDRIALDPLSPKGRRHDSTMSRSAEAPTGPNGQNATGFRRQESPRGLGPRHPNRPYHKCALFRNRDGRVLPRYQAERSVYIRSPSTLRHIVNLAVAARRLDRDSRDVSTHTPAGTCCQRTMRRRRSLTALPFSNSRPAMFPHTFRPTLFRTDGQIFLESDLFNSNVRPAINAAFLTRRRQRAD